MFLNQRCIIFMKMGQAIRKMIYGDNKCQDRSEDSNFIDALILT